MLQRTKCYMILALLVVTGLASHDGTYVTQQQEQAIRKKAQSLLVAVQKNTSSRPQ